MNDIEPFLQSKGYAESSKKTARKALALYFKHGCSDLTSYRESLRECGKTEKTITRNYSPYVKAYLQWLRDNASNLQPRKVEQNKKQPLEKTLEQESVKPVNPIKEKCGDCKFHLKRGVCPRAEYKKYADNIIACSSTDSACELFQPKKKQANNANPDMGKILILLNAEFIFKCPTDTEEILGYEDGQYKPFKHVIKNKLEKLYGDALKRNFVDETLAHIQRANYIERKEINKFINKIPLQNGLFNLLNREVEPFDSEQVSLTNLT